MSLSKVLDANYVGHIEIRDLTLGAQIRWCTYSYIRNSGWSKGNSSERKQPSNCEEPWNCWATLQVTPNCDRGSLIEAHRDTFRTGKSRQTF